MIREIFAKNLKYYRFKKGISQEKLAEICNLHPTMISDYERMKSAPTLNTIEKLSIALNIEIYQLFMTDNIHIKLKSRINTHNDNV